MLVKSFISLKTITGNLLERTNAISNIVLSALTPLHSKITIQAGGSVVYGRGYTLWYKKEAP